MAPDARDPLQPQVVRRSRLRTRWGVVTALILVAVLGAWLAVKWPSPDEARLAVDPEAQGRAPIGTVGTTSNDGRVPGATASSTANVPVPGEQPYSGPWTDGAVVAYLDRQPLYAVGTGPISIPDANMMREGATEAGKPGAGHILYVPRDAARSEEASARYFYLRAGPNSYLRVRLFQTGKE